MDTKLRSISTNPVTKVITIVLFVVCVTAIVVQVQYITYKNLNPESLLVENYLESDEFLRYIRNSLNLTHDIALNSDYMPMSIEFIYLITDVDGEPLYTNTQETDKSFFEQHDSAYYAYENGAWTAGAKTKSFSNTFGWPMMLHYFNKGYDYNIYVAFPDELLAEKQLNWQSGRAHLYPIMVSIVVCIALALLSTIFLISVTGREPEDRGLHLSRLDNIYSDILLLFLLASVAVIVVILSTTNVRYGGVYYSTASIHLNQIYSMVLWGAVTVIASLLGCITLLSIVRKIKAGKLLKHSLTYTVLAKLYDICQSIFDGRMLAGHTLTKSLFYRQLIFIAVSAVLAFFILFLLINQSLLFLFPLLLEGLVIYWFIKGNNETFTDIEKGFNESIEEQLRAERMKVALVTNVSHDLKTPLTSIISYAELLAKEENLPDSASDYVRILNEKANRLKQIVSDLFDLSKSTTGNIALDLERLDVKKLIEQTLADMEDKIEKSGLQVKTKLPENPVDIIADGKKLYRVFQNVIDNALKYSLKGTRIYVELTTDNNEAVATIKNTSAYEMEFSADEILQRFSRGDKSRSTEGSGLGLSIAESFTNVSGGALKVDIDGDMFKVTIKFNRVP